MVSIGEERARDGGYGRGKRGGRDVREDAGGEADVLVVRRERRVEDGLGAEDKGGYGREGDRTLGIEHDVMD